MKVHRVDAHGPKSWAAEGNRLYPSQNQHGPTVALPVETLLGAPKEVVSAGWSVGQHSRALLGLPSALPFSLLGF